MSIGLNVNENKIMWTDILINRNVKVWEYRGLAEMWSTGTLIQCLW